MISPYYRYIKKLPVDRGCLPIQQDLDQWQIFLFAFDKSRLLSNVENQRYDDKQSHQSEQ